MILADRSGKQQDNYVISPHYPLACRTLDPNAL